MPFPAPTTLRLLLASILVSGAAAGQVPKSLLGSWIGASEENRGEKLVIEKDVIVIDGERQPYRLQSPGVIVIGGEGGERAEFAIEGDVLTFTLDGESATYKRDGAAPPARSEPKPTDEGRTGTPPGAEPPNPPGKPGANPLGKPAGDPFARAFRGRDLELTLEGRAADGYRGKLVFQGTTYRAEATARGSDLSGRFQSGADWFDFKATLDGDHMKFESGGTTYELEGAPLPAGRPTNPLGRSPGGNGERGGEAVPETAPPPALDGVFAGATKRYEHPRGWFGFDMPEGWSVHQESGTGMLLNPGLTAADTLDAIIGLMWGRLETAEQNVAVGKIIAQRLPLLQKTLAEQGIPVGEPEGEIKTFRGKDVPGAVVVLRGETQQAQKFQVWFGGIVKRDAWIAVSGVILDGKEAVYLPKLKRIFASLEPRPPERNQKLEAALVGRSFSSSQYGRVTESAHHASYTFAAGGAVSRRLMSNVISKPGLPGVSADSETSGRYEVCGDVLYLYFESGQEVGQVTQQGGNVTGIRIGSAVYQ
jgi:hypothetical protein